MDAPRCRSVLLPLHGIAAWYSCMIHPLLLCLLMHPSLLCLLMHPSLLCRFTLQSGSASSRLLFYSRVSSRCPSHMSHLHTVLYISLWVAECALARRSLAMPDVLAGPCACSYTYTVVACKWYLRTWCAHHVTADMLPCVYGGPRALSAEAVSALYMACAERKSSSK